MSVKKKRHFKGVESFEKQLQRLFFTNDSYTIRLGKSKENKQGQTLSPKVWNSKLQAITFSFEGFRSKKYPVCQQISKRLAYSQTHTERTPWKGRDWDTTLPFSSDLSFSHSLCSSMMHKKSTVPQRSESEEWNWSSAMIICAAEGVSSTRKERRPDENSQTLNEGKKHSKCHKKQNSAKKNRNNKERDGESKITWTWQKFEINCAFINLTTICSWNSCSLLFRLLWKAST